MKSFATSICPIKKSSRSEYEASPRHTSLASRSSTECWPIRGLFHGHRGAHWVLQSVFGTATLPTGASEPSPRGEAVIYRPFGTATLPRGVSEASPRGKGVIYRVFGTAPPPTTISVASPRGEEGFYRHVGTATLPATISVASPRGEEGFYRHVGTATLPADALVASSRSHYELVYGIVALLGFVKFTWYELLLIIK